MNWSTEKVTINHAWWINQQKNIKSTETEIKHKIALISESSNRKIKFIYDFCNWKSEEKEEVINKPIMPTMLRATEAFTIFLHK